MTKRVNKVNQNIKSLIHNSLMKSNTKEELNRMINCLLSEHRSNCKSCSDIDSCIFLTDAIFAYNCKSGKHFISEDKSG